MEGSSQSPYKHLGSETITNHTKMLEEGTSSTTKHFTLFKYGGCMAGIIVFAIFLFIAYVMAAVAVSRNSGQTSPRNSNCSESDMTAITQCRLTLETTNERHFLDVSTSPISFNSSKVKTKYKLVLVQPLII